MFQSRLSNNRCSLCGWHLRYDVLFQRPTPSRTSNIEVVKARAYQNKPQLTFLAPQQRFCTTTTTASVNAMESITDPRLPVTILTGFLGSGKTTLLNTILSQNHGRRVAIIENEFGAIDIDSSLIRAKQTVEGVDVIESFNGCICCSVRSDLMEGLERLIATKSGEFDHVIIETTGMADPRPIISIFSTTHISSRLRLDGVVTMVDAKHVERHLDDKKADPEAVNEALQQIAYADRIILNKTDLVEGEDLKRLHSRVKTINGMAVIQQAERANVSVDYVLGVGGFDLDRIPKELEEPAAHDHGHDHGHGHAHTEHSHSESHEVHEVYEESSGNVHDEYHSSTHSHSHSHDHKHDDSIMSSAVTIDGDLDMDRLNTWLVNLLNVMSEDLFRYKGILAIQGVDQQYVFQGVHDQFEGRPGRDWRPDEKRRSQMVFIGRHLEDDLLQETLETCRAKQSAEKAAAPV